MSYALYDCSAAEKEHMLGRFFCSINSISPLGAYALFPKTQHKGHISDHMKDPQNPYAGIFLDHLLVHLITIVCRVIVAYCS